MKEGPKILLAVSIVVIALIVWHRFDEYVLKHNFFVHAAVPCDPSEGTCFVADCSPEEDEECDVSPYKKIDVLSSIAPACIEEHTCEAFACTPGTDCTETFCDDETLEDGEVCLVPEEEVLEESPAEEVEEVDTNPQPV